MCRDVINVGEEVSLALWLLRHLCKCSVRQQGLEKETPWERHRKKEDKGRVECRGRHKTSYLTQVTATVAHRHSFSSTDMSEMHRSVHHTSMHTHTRTNHPQNAGGNCSTRTFTAEGECEEWNHQEFQIANIPLSS